MCVRSWKKNCALRVFFWIFSYALRSLVRSFFFFLSCCTGFPILSDCMWPHLWCYSFGLFGRVLLCICLSFSRPMHVCERVRVCALYFWGRWRRRRNPSFPHFSILEVAQFRISSIWDLAVETHTWILLRKFRTVWMISIWNVDLAEILQFFSSKWILCERI